MEGCGLHIGCTYDGRVTTEGKTIIIGGDCEYGEDYPADRGK